MSGVFYLNWQTLHSLPNFASKTKIILVGSGQHIIVLLVIPVIINLHGHRLELYTLVSEIHDNIDEVLLIENMYVMEGVVNTRSSCVHFLNRSIPFFQGCM